MRRKYWLSGPKQKEKNHLSPDNGPQIKCKSISFIAAGLSCSILSFGSTFFILHADQPGKEINLISHERYPTDSYVSAAEPMVKLPPENPDLNNHPPRSRANRSNHQKNQPAALHINQSGTETAPKHTKDHAWLVSASDLQDDDDLSTFVQQMDTVDSIYLSGFELQPTGEVKSTPATAKILVQILPLAREKGVNVYPAVESGNDPDRIHHLISTPQSRKQTVNQMQQFVLANQFAGLILNLEPIYTSDRKFFTLFVEGLTKQLEQQKKTVSLPASTRTVSRPAPNPNLSQDNRPSIKDTITNGHVKTDLPLVKNKPEPFTGKPLIPSTEDTKKSSRKPAIPQKYGNPESFQLPVPPVSIPGFKQAK
ncbi:hypothetical protein ACFO25_09500 [Paenactinomyces guangxiensis]|uniref:Chitinase n=1 Tax=Paenactinomyces guangxiensis TaxID=1490290 RepID=A0A7W2A5V5_9BACL|nr:hypothetical protein [Paenactinomyces guangxiensis]MBA4492721.1 hypothetical protein [Paenactinomyces guangxiensis]MBH8590430.1 hypothetical protein [Paenactinomyces guangxiensis]